MSSIFHSDNFVDIFNKLYLKYEESVIVIFLWIIPVLLLITSIVFVSYLFVFDHFLIQIISFLFSIVSFLLGYYFFSWIKTKNYLSRDLNERTNMDEFKSMFKKGKYDEFIKRAIEIKIIDEDLNWIFKEDKASVRSTLFYHLNNQNYLKENLKKSNLTKCINLLFNKKDDKTMYSKPQYNYENLKLLENQYPEFMIFNID